MARKPLPALLAFTDPARPADLARLIAALRPGAALVLRTFGAADSAARAHTARRLTRRAGVKLLIGADAALAAAVGADGVHLPERLAHHAIRVKRARPGWLVTVAAHGTTGLVRAARSGAHASVLSAVFASRSASAGPPLGATRFAAMVRAARLPVYGLGGIDVGTARLLRRSRAVGLAAVDGIRT